MSKHNEMGIVEFVEKYKSEESCREFLFKKRFPNGFVCQKCGSLSHGLIAKRNLYQCKDCRYQCSVTAGTVMHRTHIPLNKWFIAMYLLAKDKRGYSALNLSNELKLTYKSAWYLLKRLQTAMGQRDSEYVLSDVVEVDDTYFGGKKKGGKRGRGTDKSKVLVAVSKTDKGKLQYMKMQVVDNLRYKTIKNFTLTNIKENSQIQTDSYHSYRKLSEEKFAHEYEIYNPESSWLHWLHILIGNAKSFVNGTFHGLKKKYLQQYLNEFCYRFNRRYLKDSIFDRLLVASAKSTPLTLAELKG